MSDRFFDGVPQHFEQSRHSDTRYRSSSYVDAMQSSYHANDVSSTRTLYQPTQFRHSDSGDRQRQRSPHFHRRHTEDGYDSYAQQQSQQQLYPTSAATYDHYYNNNSSSRQMPNCDDKRQQQQQQQGFSDYPVTDMFYNGQTENRIDAERSPLLKPNDNHLEPNGSSNSGNYYPNPFNNHVTSYVNDMPNFSSVVAVSANPAMMTSSVTTSVLPPSSQQQQHYPAETINITNNKNYWEWNNNGYPGAAVDYNGGMRNYEYTAETKQFISSNTRYPDVLQKDHQTGFNVSFCHTYLSPLHSYSINQLVERK